MGQNHIFPLFWYPTIGRPKMEVVARDIIFNETNRFLPIKNTKKGVKTLIFIK